MPRRNDLKKILIIGSGPIVIGQACEFDYSGTQACKALREEGYTIVLVNSNPATIMTDPSTADITYIEPLTPESLEEIIKKERPDALLPNLGGQTGLNLAAELSNRGILDKYGVEIVGVKADAIERGEDRIAFKETMAMLGIPVPRSKACTTVEEAVVIAEELKCPVVIRPAYTLGGTGGGIAYNIKEVETIATRGIAASLIGQILIEESVIGWEELELEVVRDAKNQKITVCFIENVDAMGIHTGDSFCVAPMLTIDESLQRKLQEISYRIVDAIGVIGGTNIQFAHNKSNGDLVVIEINPRTSRSSALASKATGFPIARVSTKLAVGITMDEIPYWKEGTLEKYKPSGDYVVVKFARWAFEKFPQAKDILGTQMKAVGEVMSIGATFKEALQKSIRSLEINRYGLGNIPEFMSLSPDELRSRLYMPSSKRIFLMYEALRRGITVEELYQITHIGQWFIQEMLELVQFEEGMREHEWKSFTDDMLIKAKDYNFADRYLASLFSVSEKTVRERRISLGKTARYRAVPVSGVENAAYYYSTYNSDRDDVPASSKPTIMILGGGPNRIGQGIEFDYTCVHAALALREEHYETIMVNCNPETVSTDYDTSDKLYFEPLTVEDVLAIYDKEKPEGVIVQFGGQTPLNIAQELKDNGVKIMGTSPESIRLAEDREYFRDRMIALGITQPDSGAARSEEEAFDIAERIGYPLMVRPSFVLGGRGMRIIYTEDMLKRYITEAIEITPDYPMLIDRFLEDALEIEVDALSDGERVYVGTVMEHIERAGIHSGDSACVIPSRNIAPTHLETVQRYTELIARELKVIGIINIQFAICRNTVYILEANPRASRTVPIVSKILNVNMARIATKLMLGKKLVDFPELEKKTIPYFGVKEAVFPFKMFPEVDPLLGPEMKATGEVMGISTSFGLAFYKAQVSTGVELPRSGNVLITVNDKDKPAILSIARSMQELGFTIFATENTSRFLDKYTIKNRKINKITEERPHILDSIINGEIHLIINTPLGSDSTDDDSFIRMLAIQRKIPYVTTIEAAKATVEGIYAVLNERNFPVSLQEYYKDL